MILILLSTCGLASARTPSGGAQAYSWDDTALFVIGNALFTVYHEVGHALIDLLDLPVIGREEDAVDGFAAVMMIPPRPDPVRDEFIIAVADGWRLQGDLGLFHDGGRDFYWGEHALDEQRHYAIVCLMVGSDQKGFFDFALEAGLPPERIQSCSDDFARMKSGWDRLLAPHRPRNEDGEARGGEPIKLHFDTPSERQQQLVKIVQQSGFLQEATARLGAELLLPSPIAIHFSACDEANAYWSNSAQEVTICYALLDEFRSLLSGLAKR